MFLRNYWIKIRKGEALLFFWFFKNCELIRDSSLWWSNFIPLVHDSIIIIGSRSVTYTFGSRFACKRWVRVFYQNLNFSFLGQVFQYFYWVSKRVYWGSHHISLAKGHSHNTWHVVSGCWRHISHFRSICTLWHCRFSLVSRMFKQARHSKVLTFGGTFNL